MTWFLYFVILLLLVVVYFKNYLRLLCICFRMPGPWGWPIIGNMLEVNHLTTALDDLIDKYQSERIFRVWITIFPYFFLMYPKDIRMVLQNTKVTEKTAMFHNLMKSVVGEGLITSSGSKWEVNRKVIQSVFNVNVLKTFVSVFSVYSEDLVKLLEDKHDVNIAPYINKFVLKTSWHTILGISSCSDAEFITRKQMVGGHNKMDFWAIMKALCNKISLNSDKQLIKTQLHHLIKELIVKNRQLKESRDFKSLLDWFSEISDGCKDFTEEDVINETTTFIHASYDTLRSAITFTLHMIAKHQEVQENVVEELDNILGSTTHITIDELNQMQYLEQCIKESMRLYPSAPIIFRETIVETKFGDVVLPEGTNLFISPYLIHRLPKIFPDPLAYNPDRFSSENLLNIDSYAYLPFSMGPRNCIGYKYAILEMKTVIASILRMYHISITPGHEKLNLVVNITLSNRGGMWLRFQKRINNTWK